GLAARHSPSPEIEGSCLMTAAIIPFDFEEQAVRVVMIDGDPVFVAADVCRSLEIGKYRDAVARLDADEGCPVIVDTLGGRQTMTAVTESGLYALIMMSRKPAAKRFRKWVTSVVLPAIRRDGSYSLDGSDRQDLDEKRAYYAALPDAHRTRADSRAEALRQVEELIAQGSRVGAAIEAVALEAGLSARTLYNYRRATYMVGRSDWPAAMAPRWSGPRKALPDCHPEVLKLFIDLAASPARGSDIYRRMVEVAEQNGWAPIPCQRTMYRLRSRLVSRTNLQVRVA
ncbi:MAG: BRO family protein, partial [Paracoccus sp. (in: a-proteobacteria)]